MIIGKTRTNQPVESDAGLDAKLVNLPLPATSGQGGKVLGVNAGGTAYELKDPSAVNEVLIDNVVDSNGNNRFIGGNINTETITGFTFTYAKWSLSGTHLMVVLAGSVNDETTYTGDLGSISLPDWIKAKIYPTVSNLITSQTFDAWNSDYTRQDLNVNMWKTGAGLSFSCSFTATADRTFRVAFDLLIDNE